MSRSIHTTHREYARARHWRYSSGDVRAQRLTALRAALRKKQRVKRWSRLEGGPALELPPLATDDLPIEIVDAGPRLHYPASPDDIRAVLRRLPPGVAGGLARIRLVLGLAHQEEGLSAERRRDEERDPWFGRVGEEILPGVHTGRVLGTFDLPSARIDLYAYVYEPELPDRRRWECYLRLVMLATLLHEVAHFEDFKLRTARGRWRADDREKSEPHAEKVAASWIRGIVVPWLQEAHAEGVRDLATWSADNGGTALPLELLAGSWRWDASGRVVGDSLFGGAPAAFEGLVRNLHAGDEPSSARLQFAEELHWSELYPEARRVLARILQDEPADLAAQTLLAGISWHEEDYAQAESLARRVIAQDQACADAWRVLADVHEARADWQRLYDSAGRALDEIAEERERWGLREQRARAALELGRETELARDLEVLEDPRSVPAAVTVAAALRALQLLRKGRFEDALEIVQLPRAHVFARHRAVLDAVRFEAAHRLGRPGLAGRLAPETVRLLRLQHHGPWADQLASEFGPGKTY